MTQPINFNTLTFDGFRKLATDSSLSKYEKIGFPDSYRQGYEEHIFSDICNKCKNLDKTSQTIIDIGPGCSELASMLIDHCERNNHFLILIDSAEVLSLLPDKHFITKIAARFPHNCSDICEQYMAKADVIIAYSVFHYIYVEDNFFNFIDSALMLLANGGEMLIGDIPNTSKRKRFFSSETGIAFHKEFMKTDALPEINHLTLEPGKIDDSVVFSVLMHCREAGFDSYLLPQDESLPMANRREDICIKKP